MAWSCRHIESIVLLFTLVLVAQAAEPQCTNNPDDKTSSCQDTMAMLQGSVEVGNLLHGEYDKEEAAEEEKEGAAEGEEEAAEEEEGEAMDEEDQEEEDGNGDEEKGMANNPIATHAGAEATVSLSADGQTLVYTPNARGDVIPDFAHVGYKGDLVPLPTEADVIVRETLEAMPQPVPAPARFECGTHGDDTARIQAAVDKVSALDLDAAGFRGAVLLGSGVFCVSSTIKISASGVVLRGSGAGGTVLRAAGHRQYTVVDISGPGKPSNRKEVSYSWKTRHYIDDAYVPVGSFSFSVTPVYPHRKRVVWAVGDLLVVERPGTQQWIHDVGMDRIPDCTPPLPGRKCEQWTPRRYNMKFERIVTAVDGNKLTLDAPIVQGLDPKYGKARVYKAASYRISNVGVEHLSIVSDYSHPTDETHAKNGIVFEKVMHSWALSITCKHLVFACTHIDKRAKHITVKDSTSLAPISKIAGGRRYAFSVNGQMNLVTGCHSDSGRHAFVSGSIVAGPNVWANSKATNEFADIGPHMRWSYGQLYDNIQGRQMQAWDRGRYGSGHGWSGNTIVFYNCEVFDDGDTGLPINDGNSHRRRRRRRHGFTVSSPVGGANYCIGCKVHTPPWTGDPRNYQAKVPACCGKGGHFQSNGALRTDIPSLYDMQLAIQKRDKAATSLGR